MIRLIDTDKLVFCIEMMEAPELGHDLPFLHLEFPTPPTKSMYKYIRTTFKDEFLQMMSDVGFDAVFTYTNNSNKKLAKFQKLMGFEKVEEFGEKTLYILETP